MEINKKYKYVLIDLDDTLLDFKRAELYAFNQLLNYFKINSSINYFELYKQVNQKLWADFELGLVAKEKLAIQRFEQTFKDLRLDYELMNEIFLAFIAEASFPIEGAYDLLSHLKSRYKVYIISNGIKNLQLQRLNHSRIMEFVDGYVFSEETIKPKPDKSYFDYFLKKYNLKFIPEEFIIIGDSETSDLQAAINLEVDSIWYNPNLRKTSLKYSHEVKELTKIKEII